MTIKNSQKTVMHVYCLHSRWENVDSITSTHFCFDEPQRQRQTRSVVEEPQPKRSEQSDASDASPSLASTAQPRSKSSSAPIFHHCRLGGESEFRTPK